MLRKSAGLYDPFSLDNTEDITNGHSLTSVPEFYRATVRGKSGRAFGFHQWNFIAGR